MKKLYLFTLLFALQLLTAQYCIQSISSGWTLGDDIEGVIIEDINGYLLLNL